MTEPDCEQGLMTINENSAINCWRPPEDSSTINIGSTLETNDNRSNPESSAVNAFSFVADPPAGSMNSTSKVH